ncbi:MAG: molybdopterin-dependent oxidoreductase [Aeromicrobium erythreum]
MHSKFILIWAANIMSTNLHLWPYIAEAKKRGAKVVVVDPVRTKTARQASQHIPIRPGTDGALALAMMHVIIDEGLTDDEYIASYTVGYDELVERVQQYTPEWASEETGIPVETIRTLAREYATSQAVGDPHRRRRRAARRRRPDRPHPVVPARPRRGMAQPGRRHPAAPAVGVPRELARLHAPPSCRRPGRRSSTSTCWARRSPASWS